MILSTGSFTYKNTNNTNPQTGLPNPEEPAMTGILANLELGINPTNSSSYTYQDEQGNNIGTDINLEPVFKPN